MCAPLAAVAVACVCTVPQPAAAAATATPRATPSGPVLYVDGARGATCSDTASGAGTQAVPFCTLQAAADVVAAADTVLVTRPHTSASASPPKAPAAAPITPARLLDTRNGTGTGGHVGKLTANTPDVLTVAGTDNGVIQVTGVTAVAVNLTVVSPVANSIGGSSFVAADPYRDIDTRSGDPAVDCDSARGALAPEGVPTADVYGYFSNS
jgi:hypothetical protein